MTTATVRHQAGHVELIIDGRLVASVPWEQAQQLHRVIHAQAKRAEEWAKAEQIARDQAMLIRAGANIGLTSHPLIQAEAKKVAEWNRQLRRAMPGIKSEEQFGAPSLRQTGPKLQA